MSWFGQNITQNPLLVEARRFGRKLIGSAKSRRTNNATIVLCLLVYLTVLGIAFANRGSFSGEHIALFQTFVFCFAVPSITYGAIAGERERRSWDLLTVAPISKTQIVLGKFISAVLIILGIAVLMLPLVLICSLSSGDSYTAFGPKDRFIDVFASECASIGFAVGFAAICVFISSLMARAFSAQAAIYACLFVWMILWPMLIAAIPRGFSEDFNAYLLWVHPFMAIAQILSYHDTYSFNLHAGDARIYYSAQTQLAFYSGIAIVFLALAIAAIRERKNPLARKG